MLPVRWKPKANLDTDIYENKSAKIAILHSLQLYNIEFVR
jgi:hypothetical protein